MYVCICNGHRAHDIREAAKSGLSCAVAIYRRLGKPPRCGRCLDFAAKVIAEARGEDAGAGLGTATQPSAASLCSNT
jgi:bacterioferritin-associated ferredoxin